jgi:hypothetical protein
MTVDDHTMLSGNHVWVPLPDGHHHLVYIYLASVIVPYVTANLRTPIKVEHAVIAQSTVHLASSYVVPATIDIDGLSLTPDKTRLAKKTYRKFELLHFGYMAQWEYLRGDVISRHKDSSKPRQFFLYPRSTSPDCGRI